MKILLLNQTFYPDNVATAQQTADLARFLAKEGHEVSVICDSRSYECRTRIFKREENWCGVKVFRLLTTGFGKRRLRYRLLDSFSFFVSAFFKLTQFPRQDLVISFTSPPLVGVLGTLFCLFRGGESIQWLMDINPDSAFQVGYLKRKSFLGRALNSLLEFTLTRAKYVVVLDRWMKETAIKHGALEASVVVIPPWSVFKEDEPGLEESVRAFKKEHQLENKFLVLYSGNHSVVHPLDTLLETARCLRADETVLFLFIGAGLRTKDVSDYKTKHGLTNIRQLPLQPREKVKASFGAADLHCVVMGSGMSGLVHVSKVYSVLASGKPFVFVGPSESHIGDLIQENQLGEQVEWGNNQDFIKAIQRIRALNPGDHKAIKTKSHQVVREYEPELTLRKFYKEVIESDQRGSVPLSYEVSIP